MTEEKQPVPYIIMDVFSFLALIFLLMTQVNTTPVELCTVVPILSVYKIGNEVTNSGGLTAQRPLMQTNKTNKILCAKTDNPIICPQTTRVFSHLSNCMKC